MTLRSPLHRVAEATGATFSQWRQWELAASFGDAKREYLAAKEGVAVHDSSYVGRIKATGADALDLLNRLSTNLVEKLMPGHGTPTVLTTDRGRILDLVYVLNQGPYVLLMTSPGLEDQVIQWLDKYTIMEDVTLEELTCRTCMLTLLGPKAPAVIKAITGSNPETLELYQSLGASVGDLEVSLIRMDSSGLLTYHLVAAEGAEKVWDAVLSESVTPLGMEAWEILRVEAGIPAYGKEIGDAYNPLEAGLVGSIDFNKGCYIGQEIIARLDTYQKVQRSLVAFDFADHARAQEGARLALQGKEVAVITSLARIPTSGRLVGLGYVGRGAAKVGGHLSLLSEGEGSVKIREILQLFGPPRE